MAKKLLFHLEQIGFLMSCNQFFGLYTYVHGDLKFKEVTEKTLSSKIVMSNIKQSQIKNFRLTVEYITDTIVFNPVFLFANCETVVLASLIMVAFWADAVNNKRELNKMQDVDLELLCREIINKYQSRFSKKFENNVDLIMTF